MAVKPTPILQWANNDIDETKTINGSVETLPNKIEPTQEFADSGLLFREPLPRSYLNYFLNLTAQYIDYLDLRADEHEESLVRDSIVAASAKITLVDADSFGIVDSADSNNLKEITWGNLKASFPNPSTTARTILELATSAEAIAGVDTDRAITPAALKAALDDFLASHLEAGTTTVFYQTNAPVGWTKSTSVNDTALHITSGVDGGTTSGSWTISGLTIQGHALSISEMPDHEHVSGSISRSGVTSNYGSTSDSGNTGDVSDIQAVSGKRNKTSSVGGGNTHTHGLTSAGTWRPAHAKFILCVKN